MLVEAGPEQARTWRGEDWKGTLPDLIFPTDRSWLASTLWDDDWTCFGGPRALVDAFLADPELGVRTDEVDPRPRTLRRPATSPTERASNSRSGR